MDGITEVFCSFFFLFSFLFVFFFFFALDGDMAVGRLLGCCVWSEITTMRGILVT
ncbi:hypothetical protein B0I37DRAFT_375289 [Chaetomium sp. MPI-CAGE-AT-0009]|nr:hypothetical protein B0I37DRAFT_375289 [Chaetomium sp. MPI-CAGE-AT-0009]